MEKNEIELEAMHKRLNELYQLDWMMSHGYSLRDLINCLGEIQEEEREGNINDLFEKFESDMGFGCASLYVCFAEFMVSEFLDPNYVKHLCDSDMNGEALYQLYISEVTED